MTFGLWEIKNILSVKTYFSKFKIVQFGQIIVVHKTKSISIKSFIFAENGLMTKLLKYQRIFQVKDVAR